MVRENDTRHSDSKFLDVWLKVLTPPPHHRDLGREGLYLSLFDTFDAHVKLIYNIIITYRAIFRHLYCICKV
jgi:hypothetical protein